MGNLKQTHDSRNRKHSAVGKPNRGSAVFRTFIACVTAFTLMMPITATAAIANDESDYDPDATEVSVAETVDNGAIAGEGETGDEPSSVGADGEDAPDGEAVSGDADKTAEEKADGTDTAKDGKDAVGEGAADKDAEDKDAKAEDDQGDKDAKDDADGKDSDGQDADDETADKAPETVESKGTVIDEAEDADDEAADKKGADEKEADKDDEAENMPAQAFEASLTTENGESLTVHVKAPKGAFPLDTTMKVTSVQSEDVPEAVEKAVSARTDDAVVDMQAVDISFKDVDGKEIEPAKKVTVTFTSDLISKDDESMLVHVDDEGKANVLDPLSDKELKNRGVEANENELLVDSDEFSMYVLTLTGQLTADVLTADGKTYKITVSFDEAAEIPEGATLNVTEIEAGTDEYEEYLDQAAKALGQENGDSVPYARFFDIEIRDADGAKVEPEAPVQVKIELADAPEAEQNPLQVVHFEGDDETPIVVETKADEEADVCFEAESFSTWAVITVPEIVTELDGLTATISRNGLYATAGINWRDGQQPYRLWQSYNSDDAAQWHFESAGGGYHIYTLDGNGEKLYLHMVKCWFGYDPGMSNVTVQPTTNQQAVDQGCPQTFTVFSNEDGTYTIRSSESHDLIEDYGFYGRYNDGRNRLTLNFRQPTTQSGEEYAVIIQSKNDPKTYYAVQNDGSLQPVLDVTKDEYGAVTEVELETPFFWTYGTEYCRGGMGWYNGDVQVLYMHEEATGYDDDKRAEGFYYTCINPNVDEGISKEPKKSTTAQVMADRPGFIAQVAIQHYENHRIQGWNNYLGISPDESKIIGNVSAGDAATVYLAKVKSVPPSGDEHYSNHETVDHIDIAIQATATLEFPLAYGTYYNEEGDPILTVTPGHDVTLKLEEKIPITKEDMMNATITAKDKNGTELDDAYYITGYSSNDDSGYSMVQVRMEGSFKVDTLGEYNGPHARSNDDSDWKRLRLANQVYYTVSTAKNVSFDLTYEDEQGVVHKLCDNQGNQITYTTEEPVPVEATFSYWDENNECPPLQDTFESTYSGADYARDVMHCDFIAGSENRNYMKWKSGAIIDNDWAPYWEGDCFIGVSGMDFVLAVEVDVPNNLLAYEITKYIVDTDGNPIKPAEDVTNNITVYHKADGDPSSVANGYAVDTPAKEGDADLASKQAGYEKYDNMTLVVPGGEKSEGVASDYNYHPDSGMFYVEEEAGQNLTITDVNGTVWKYKETRVETEYVWRNDRWNTKDYQGRHVAEGYSGVPDVLGDYTFEGWEEANNGEQPRNKFLEFYVYNVYEPVYGDIEITKTVNGTSLVGTSCVVHLEGTTPAGGKYESYAEITYGPGGTGSVVVKHIPAGTKLTITEEYSGAGYDGDTKTLTATIEADKTVTPDDGGQFVNMPNDDVVRGHGIQNNFELMENGEWEFTASQSVQSQSEDQE